MTRGRLTGAARKRFPDIATGHGTTTTLDTEPQQWHRVEWTHGEWARGRITWHPAEDLELVRDDETDISK